MFVYIFCIHFVKMFALPLALVHFMCRKRNALSGITGKQVKLRSNIVYTIGPRIVLEVLR